MFFIAAATTTMTPDDFECLDGTLYLDGVGTGDYLQIQDSTVAIHRNAIELLGERAAEVADGAVEDAITHLVGNCLSHCNEMHPLTAAVAPGGWVATVDLDREGATDLLGDDELAGAVRVQAHTVALSDDAIELLEGLDGVDWALRDGSLWAAGREYPLTYVW